MLHGKKIIVVMPAYHAEKTLAACHAAIPHDIVDDALLVDDASDDATVAVAERLGIHAVRHPSNAGSETRSIGRTCASGAGGCRLLWTPQSSRNRLSLFQFEQW